MAIAVSFTPGVIAGTQTGALTFFNDGNPSSVNIALTGAALPPPAPAAPSGGGSGVLDPWFILLLAGTLYLAQCMRKKAPSFSY